jgi:hypothetical protein
VTKFGFRQPDGVAIMVMGSAINNVGEALRYTTINVGEELRSTLHGSTIIRGGVVFFI